MPHSDTGAEDTLHRAMIEALQEAMEDSLELGFHGQKDIAHRGQVKPRRGAFHNIQQLFVRRAEV